MGERINEILKKLKPKEKIAIIVSMSALATILLCVVLLLAFCGADKHQHSYNYSLDMKDGKFVFVRECTAEGCDEPLYTENDVKPTVESVTEATCGKKGEIVYAYSYNGNVAKYTEYTSITGKHTLNGSAIEELLNEDGTIDESIPGVSLRNDIEINYVCGNTEKGFYKCEDCGEMVLVDVLLGHRGTVVINTVATCDTPGEQQLKCQYCFVELADPTEVAPLGHAYAFTLQQSGATKNLVGVCTRTGCTDPNYFESNVTDLEVVGTTEGNCATPSTTIYKYKNKDGETVEVTVVGETTNHTLNGVDYTTLANKDGTFSHTIEGIKLFSGKSLCELSENGGSNGYFTCEVCGQIKDVVIPVTGHNFLLDYSTAHKPTFTSLGHINFSCNNENCSLFLKLDLPAVVIGTNAEVISENTSTNTIAVKYTYRADFGQVVELVIELPNNHEHNYTYSVVENGDKKNLVGVCTAAGCLNPNFLAEDIKNLTPVKETPATCGSGKIVEYTCTAGGETISFELEEGDPTTEHILKGNVAVGENVVHVGGQTVRAFTYGDEGITLFPDQTVEAGKTLKGHFTCEYCGELVLVWVFVPADYQP